MPYRAASKWRALQAPLSTVVLVALIAVVVAAVFAAYLRPAFLMDIALFSQLCS